MQRGSGPSQFPDWFGYLVDRGVPQAWLSDLRDAILSDFTSKVPRVGLFLDPFSGKTWQPTVKFFCDFNIPIWYRWSADQEKMLAWNSNLAYLRPPAEHLQMATTHISRSPSPLSPDSSLFEEPPVEPFPRHVPLTSTSSHPQPMVESFPTHTSPAPTPIHPHPPVETDPGDYVRRRDAYLATKPWETFFAARDEENRASLLTETPKKRGQRLNWEHQRPVSGKVYIWEWSDDDFPNLVRRRVPDKQRIDAVCAHPGAQGRYDPFHNVWDLCRYFSPAQKGATYHDEDEDESDEEEDIGKRMDTFEDASSSMELSETAGAAQQKMTDEYIAQRVQLISQKAPSLPDASMLESSSSRDEPDLAISAGPLDLVSHLHLHYGYVSPLPVPPPDNVSSDTWNNVIKPIGLCVGDRNPPPVDFAPSMIRFLQGLQSPALPPPDLWDFRPESRLAINRSSLALQIPKCGDYFIVAAQAFRVEHGCKWTIAFDTAFQAVRAYRLLIAQHHSPTSLARKLVEEGVSFHTFLPFSQRPSLALAYLETFFPIRIRNYHFDADDYHVYVRKRARLLGSPRGRAALLVGGIVARIALEHLGTDAASFGPSSAVTKGLIGFTHVAQDGTIFWDDALTDDELSVICGGYRSYTGKLSTLEYFAFVLLTHSSIGMGTQAEILSWWPLPHSWANHNANSYNFGHWTEWNEEWYQTRLSDILTNNARPLNAQQWRMRLRPKGGTIWRATTKAIITASAALYPDNA